MSEKYGKIEDELPEEKIEEIANAKYALEESVAMWREDIIEKLSVHHGIPKRTVYRIWNSC